LKMIVLHDVIDLLNLFLSKTLSMEK
jgi:hypothetical protein